MYTDSTGKEEGNQMVWAYEENSSRAKAIED